MSSMTMSSWLVAGSTRLAWYCVMASQRQSASTATSRWMSSMSSSLRHSESLSGVTYCGTLVMSRIAAFCSLSFVDQTFELNMSADKGATGWSDAESNDSGSLTHVQLPSSPALRDSRGTCGQVSGVHLVAGK